MQESKRLAKTVIEGELKFLKVNNIDSEYPYAWFAGEENTDNLFYEFEGKKVKITIEEVE
jgi:hypothetical protein